MEKLFVNALNQTLASTQTIHNTNLEEGVVIGEAKINSQIAQAIRTLKDVQGFGKGTVSVVISYIPTEFDGYIFQISDTIIFLEYVEKSREIERIIINKEEGDYPSFYLLQSLILLEMLTDTSSLNLKDEINKFVHLPFIEEGTVVANEFATLVRNIESLIFAGTYEPFDETEVQEELSVFSVHDLLDAMGVKERIETLEAVHPIIEEIDSTNTEAVSLESIDAPAPIVETETEIPVEKLEQISLFDTTDDLEENVLPPITGRLTTAKEVHTLVESALVNGHTIDEIAKGASVAPSTIYGLKDGIKTPRQSTLDKIVNAVHELMNTHTPINGKTTPSKEVPTIISNAGGVSTSEDATAKMLEIFSKIMDANSAKANPKEEVVEKAEVPFDLNGAKSTRPLFFEDMWVRSKLKEFEIDETTINDVVSFRKGKREDILQNSPELIEDIESSFDYTGYTEPVETAIDVILEDLNLLLKGEAGSGKTTLIQSVSCLFNLPLYTINGSDESNIETIVGFKEIEKGSITFKPGRLVKAMQVGGIFYSDEANFIRPNILAIINGALDHRRELYNEFVGERIKGHKDFRFMASINENYEDTREMNRATLDRSIALEMSYMTIEQLKKLLRKTDPSTSEVNIRTLALISTALQDAAQEGTISPEVASIRNILFIQRMIRRRSFETAIARIVDKYPKEDRPAILGVLSSVDKLDISAKKIIAV